jgi:small subunit ribosomal protein S7
MPRKGPATRREMTADPVYRSLLVTQLTNKIMLHGKKSIAENIVYDAMKLIEVKNWNRATFYSEARNRQCEATT